ncbi:MAG TPA: hypothetical protein VMH34_00965 [Gammaproteobacteria bacterium]|nr:hypothetical protein [Gammaproteobacteria bacterium]
MIRRRADRDVMLRCAVAAGALYTAFASADDQVPFPGWDINGSNTLRLESYDNNGDKSASPYPFDGGQYYDEYGLNFLNNETPYDTWRLQLYGVFNASDYRSHDRGVVPERMSLVHEKGDGDLPYRAELGDYFSYYSFLTLQRSLKGLQIELQPHADSAGWQHSIVLTSGTPIQSWKNFTPHEDAVNGASWLMDNGHGSSYALNFVASHRSGNAVLGTLVRDQYTTSLAGEQEFLGTAQRVTVEGEAAYMWGDDDGVAGVNNGQDRNGNGFFGEIRGQDLHLPLDYRARVEYYTRDFQPRGGVITPDRRSVEFHAGWRFDSGLRLSGRIQAFEDAFQTKNSLDTHTVGFNLSGPMFRGTLNGVTGSMDFYVQTLDNDNNTIDQRVVNSTINLSKPLPGDWYGRLAVFLQDIDDHTPTNADLWTGQYQVSADHTFVLAGFDGTITPGIMYRNLRNGPPKADDWSPTLALRMNRGPHAVGFNYGFLTQDRHFVGATDIDTQTVAFDYRYTLRQNTFGVDFNLFDRNPNPGRFTDAWRTGIFWTYSFDRPANLAARGYEAIGGAAPAGPISADLRSLAPGVTLADATQALTSAGISGGSPQANYIVYEYPLLREIEQRQRLVLMHDGVQLTGSALIIDLDTVGNVDSLAQTFEHVRKALIQHYGNPANNFEDGDFTPSFVDDVNSQRLIRVSEWITPTGILRLGIPRRLDGQVRIEIQHQRSFPLPRETLWSIEAVR